MSTVSFREVPLESHGGGDSAAVTGHVNSFTHSPGPRKVTVKNIAELQGIHTSNSGMECPLIYSTSSWCFFCKAFQQTMQTMWIAAHIPP